MKNAERILVCGASGSGKSYHVKKKLLSDARRVIVFDTLDEYGAEGFTRVTLAGLPKALASRWGEGFFLAVRPPAGKEPKALHRVCELLIRAQRPYFEGKDSREVTLVVEEMNNSFPVTSLPADLWGMPELCSRGRHHGINLIGVSQRVAEINTRFRGNVTRGWYFRAADHTDVRTYARMMGPKWADHLRGLEPHRYVHMDGPTIFEGANNPPPQKTS